MSEQASNLRQKPLLDIDFSHRQIFYEDSDVGMEFVCTLENQLRSIKSSLQILSDFFAISNRKDKSNEVETSMADLHYFLNSVIDTATDAEATVEEFTIKSLSSKKKKVPNE